MGLDVSPGPALSVDTTPTAQSDENDAELFLSARVHESSHYMVMTVNRQSSPRLHTKLVDQLSPAQRAVLSQFPVAQFDENGHSPISSPPCYFHPRYHTTLPGVFRSVTVINSSAAGTRNGSDIYFSVLGQLLRLFGVSQIYVATDGPKSIAEHAQSFNSAATVILMGGDTSLHEFVNNLPAQEQGSCSDIRICLIPTGTGNALATSLGMSDPFQSIQRLFLEAKFASLPSFQVQFPAGSRVLNSSLSISKSTQKLNFNMLVVLSWGFHAALVADSDRPELRKLGSQRFLIAARENANKRQEYFGAIHMQPQNENLALSHSYFVITPMTHLEPTFCISPRGTPPSSGRLWMLELPAMPGQQTLDIIMKGYDDAKHIAEPMLVYQEISTPQCEIIVDDQPESQRRWCIDGQIVVSSPGTVSIKTSPALVNGRNVFICV